MACGFAEMVRDPVQVGVAGCHETSVPPVLVPFDALLPVLRIVHGTWLDRRRRASNDDPALLARNCEGAYGPCMSTMNISLPASLKSFVDRQVASRGYGTSSEYVRELIRRDRDRQRLRGLLLDGADSTPAATADRAWFARLRERTQRRTTA